MPLAPGARLGPYEITGSLGAGGMGEVYRARDTRLGRDVAVKVLPADLAGHAGARERFEREAKLVSSLNHKNICTLFDVGRDGDVEYLVMELLEGESLAARLERGPLRLEEAVRVGAEIAEALGAAHRAGVVHRDLKPGNVMLTRGGTKVLDFGIAKLAEGDSGRPGHLPTMAPTRTTPLTASGALVGTLNYMSPEQLEGKPVDHRADLFAFGALLYEMITGRRAFDGGSQASVIAAIIEREPAPCASIVPMTPPALDRLVRDCLAKDPEERRQSAHDIARELSGITQVPTGSTARPNVVTPPSRGALVLAWAVAAAAVIALMAALALGRREAPAPPDAVAFEIPLSMLGGFTTPPVVSPDGHAVAYVAAAANGKSMMVYVRRIDDPVPHAIPGTDDPTRPFWSADGKEIAYFASDKVVAVALDTGHPRTVCASSYGVGGTWSPAGVIVFSPAFYDGLKKVDAAGGTPQPLTTLDAKRGETGHLWPMFLPDGRHVIFVSRTIALESNRIEMVSIDGGPRQVVVEADALVGYSAPWLVFGKGGVLFAQRFDPATGALSGERHRLTDDAYFDENIASARAHVSGDTLAWFPHRARRVVAEWYDDHGALAGPAFEAEDVSDARVSPDATRVALAKYDAEHGAPSVWIRDLQRGTTTRVTSTPGSCSLGVWSRDGSELLYSSDVQGPYVVLAVPADGSAPSRVLLREDGADWWVSAATADGKALVAFRESAKADRSIWILNGEDPSKRGRWVTGATDAINPSISPDGHVMAFLGLQSGNSQFYARPVDGGPVTQLTSGGAAADYARWTLDGGGIWYRTVDNTLRRLSVSVTNHRVDVGSASAHIDASNIVAFDTAPGGRVLVLRDVSEIPRAATVRVGWKDALR